MLYHTSDSDVLSFRPDRTIVARVIPQGHCTDPLTIDIGHVSKTVVFGIEAVGTVETISRVDGGVSAMIRFNPDPLSLSVFRAYHSGLVFSFTLVVEPGEDTQLLRTIEVDRFAPL